MSFNHDKDPLVATHSLPKRFYLPSPRRGQPLADGVVGMIEWRKIEAELLDMAREEGHEVDEGFNGDKIVHPIENTVNLTHLAKELAERLK